MISQNYTILVTGAAGLLGSNLIRYILNHTNHSILALDNLSGGYFEYIPQNPRVKTLIKDLSNSSEIEKIFQDYLITYIIHLAAYAAEGLSPFIRCYNYQQNLVNSALLINLAIKYKIRKFLFTSSMGVYGNLNPPFQEDQTPKPIDPYGIAKYAVEMDLKVAQEQHGLDYCIIRPHNVYGPYQNVWDRYRNVLGIWMVQARKGKPITIYGDGNQVRSFSLVDSIIPFLWKSLISDQTSGQIINLGSFQKYTLNQVAQIFKRVLAQKGYSVQIEYLEKRHEIKNAYCDHSKATQLLDYTPSDDSDLEEGLLIMWEWFMKEPDREIKSWTNYEIENGLYSYWV